MTAAIALFLCAYALMLAFSQYRTLAALGAGVLFLLLGILPREEIFTCLDLNVLLMIAGTSGLVSLFTASGMPSRLAELLLEKVSDVRMAAVSLSLFAGIISAFVDNVATVLMVAPVALAICEKLKTNPVPFIISIAVSSNLQGAATLVGDTTAIMLGSALNMNFTDFFFYHGKPGMFFAVELGAVLSALILFWIFRKERAPILRNGCRTEVKDYVPSILLAASIASLIFASFIPGRPDITNGLICCFALVLGLLHRVWKEKRLRAAIEPLKAIDLNTLGMLVGLFWIIGGITHAGVMEALAGFLVRLGRGNLLLMYSVVVWLSVLISAFVDNIPYVATMIPVIGTLAREMGCDPTPLYFGLLSGATLGGNCTPIGASANITGIGILRKAGYRVRNGDFFRIGIPFTLAAVIPAYLYLWLVFGP